MTAPRRYALVATWDQWARCAYADATLDRAERSVGLAWQVPAPDTSEGAPPPLGGGLAFDAACRLYHADPEAAQVERVRWGAREAIPTRRDPPAPLPLFAAAGPRRVGAFGIAAPAAALREPRGLAIDGRDRLWIAETAADRLLVFDLWDDRLLGTVRIPGGRPVAVAAHGDAVYAILAGRGQVARVALRTGATPLPWPAASPPPSRIAISGHGRLAVLAGGATEAAEVRFPDGGTGPIAAPGATDVAWESEATLVIAGSPGADFLRFSVEDRGPAALGPLRARGYDGMGIARSPERDAAPHRIVYWTARGPRTAVPARLAYARSGRVVTIRLDRGEAQGPWGRLFLDACIPDGTAVRVRCVATDEIEDGPQLARTPPAGVSLAGLPHPSLSPPLPPERLLDPDVLPPAGGTHRRESGRELPWAQPTAGDPFRTYEAPVAASGRYLWVLLELHGDTRLTPRVRALRVEHERHDCRTRLPRTYSRDALLADFLDRYLAMPEGFLAEAAGRAQARHALLHPYAAPDRLLPWLASFVGLVLDERWARAPRPGGRTVDARRDVIAASAELWRARGTVPGLRRFLALYLGAPVVLVEQFRLRGLAGGRGGSALPADAVLGGGYRVGGPVGEAGAWTGSGTAQDAFTANAHRFTVLIPMPLDGEQLAVVRHILDLHRPAHTLVEVCTVDAGMRVGRGLHLALSSIVGPTGGFGIAQLGRSALGRGALLGRPAGTVAEESARVGVRIR